MLCLWPSADTLVLACLPRLPFRKTRDRRYRAGMGHPSSRGKPELRSEVRAAANPATARQRADFDQLLAANDELRLLAHRLVGALFCRKHLIP